MLDMFGIMFSTIMMLVVIARAAQLDSQSPWFEAPADKTAPLTGLQKARANAAHMIPTWRKSRK